MPKTLTSEAEDFSKSGKKLNEWVEEEVDVTTFKPVLSEDKNSVVIKTGVEKIKEKVFYSQSPARMVICGKHFYVPLNPKQYIFKCKNCDYHYHARIPTHKYNPETGELSNREAGSILA